MNSVADIVDKMLAPLRRRVRMIATRVIITAVNDAGGVQLVQATGLNGERIPDVERLQQFGFSGHPPKGATGLMVCIGGSRSHPVVIACDDRATRFVELQEGEAVMYAADGHSIVHLKMGGEIAVKATSKVLIDSPLLECTGEIKDHTSTMQAMRDTFNAHTHPGVTPGPATTGATATPME